MTPQLCWQKALSTNSTATSFAAQAPGNEPSGAGVFDVKSADTLEVIPFGAGAADQTLSFRVIGWRSSAVDGPSFDIPEIICDCQATLCTLTGTAGKSAVATDYFADAITVTTGIAVCPSVTANTVAKAFVDVSGYKKIKLIFNTGSSATNCNALITMYSSEE